VYSKRFMDKEEGGDVKRREGHGSQKQQPGKKEKRQGKTLTSPCTGKGLIKKYH